MTLTLAGMTGTARAAAHREVIVAAAPGDPRLAAQRAALAHDEAAMRKRDVVVRETTPDALRRAWPGVTAAPFTLLLIGRDGGIKLRREAPVDPREIAALIDTMPMRRDEMRARGQIP